MEHYSNEELLQWISSQREKNVNGEHLLLCTRINKQIFLITNKKHEYMII